MGIHLSFELDSFLVDRLSKALLASLNLKGRFRGVIRGFHRLLLVVDQGKAFYLLIPLSFPFIRG